jgi:uncharacterized protein with gpF-like domain
MEVSIKVAGKAPQEVRDYLEAKGLKPSWNWNEVWREEHGEVFTVAKAMSQAVLETLRDAVDKAIAEGQTFEQFRRRLPDVLAALGWWGEQTQINPRTGEEEKVELGTPRRLKTIYVTNARVARAVGQWQRIQRTKSSRPWLLYELGPSQRHRPEHESLAGTILSVDDSFWSTHMPPNGWGCKCRVRQLSSREAEERGGESEPPDIEIIESTGPDGQPVSHPKGVDPEWAYNPGAEPRRA